MTSGLKLKSYSRWWILIAVLLAVFQLSACGNKEPEQRKAFIEFLQNTVMRSGSKIPTLSEDQKQKFGPYVSDYTILVNFSQQLNQALDASVVPTMSLLKQVRVPQDYLTHNDAIQQAIPPLNLLLQQLTSAQQQAENARMLLKQPDDLKVVYQQVFDKLVNQPVAHLTPAINSLVTLMQSLSQVGDYLKAQGTQVSFNGNAIQFATQQQAAEYNGMMDKLAPQAAGLSAIENTFHQVQQ